MKYYPIQLRSLIPTIILVLIIGINSAYAQGFLRADGKKIVNGSGENVLLRGIGTGNWMLMEGYMMKTEGVAGTQHEFEAKLTELIGEEKTKTFFDTWLENHFTKTDVDSMKAWGFNSVRVAMHYKLFTLPVEEEPITGNNTWLLKGFKMIDNLLAWCAENEMYLILDLHAAPGGQGANADISDYDPSKPSLWESEANKAKTVALWRKLAERYSNSEWIGGYDILNETNWTFQESNNQPLRDIFERITTAIREVDTNHIIFIEGNSFANDHNGLTPPWDDNLVYSFHKYWSGTSSNDIDWMKSIRDTYDVPLWMGESGENSNTWFTEFITTCEENNIGWSWWPVKKNGINNVLFVPMSNRYNNLVKYWKGENSVKPSEQEAYAAVMEWAKNHKIENCTVQRDVIDAMMRQPHTDEVLPFAKRKVGERIYFSEFDLGKNGFAYFDRDVAHYGGDWSDWNTGWQFRNDGVDIETNNDAEGNGYNVGWTEDGEWMQFTMSADSTAIYSLNLRYTSAVATCKFHLEANGAKISDSFTLPTTNGWQNWKTISFQNILLPAGNVKLKFVLEKGGANLGFFEFVNPKTAALVDFKALSAYSSNTGANLYLVLNKDITASSAELKKEEFQLTIDGSPANILSVTRDSSSSNILLIETDALVYSDNKLLLSYVGSSVESGNQSLNVFSNLEVKNNAPLVHTIPGVIEAEDFAFNQGLSLETCNDVNGGMNTSYAAAGEYLDYRVKINQTGIYALNYRVATEHSDAELILQLGDGETFSSLDTIKFNATGGWQNWETQSSNVRLEKGYHIIRLLIKQGEHNLNWFQIDLLTNTDIKESTKGFIVYPNPANEKVTVDLYGRNDDLLTLKIIGMQGAVVLEKSIKNQTKAEIDLSDIQTGIYIIQLIGANTNESKKIMISR